MARRTVLVRGTGSIGMRHLSVLRGRLDVAVVAWPSRVERVEALRAQGVPAAASLEDVPAGPLAAVIATDTSQHLRDAHALLGRADLLIEKPLSPTCEGLRALATAAAAHNRAIYVAFCLRFDPALSWVRAHLPQLGPLHAVRIVCQSYLPDWRPGTDYRIGYAARADEGGVLRDLAHELDYAVWLFGRPGEVTASLEHGRGLEIDADVAADLSWRVAHGPVVSVRLDYLTRRTRRGLLAQGQHGEIEWDAVAQTAVLRLHDAPPETVHLPYSRDELLGWQDAAFLAALDGQLDSPLATLDEAAFVVALSDAARAASASGTTAPLSDWRAA